METVYRRISDGKRTVYAKLSLEELLLIAVDYLINELAGKVDVEEE